jgi:exonuclease SbcC
MKPLKLYIEGFQSFIQGKEIDFDVLSEGGLFGIFGNTGSGKSTVLDAMLVSLYGCRAVKRDACVCELINKTVNKAVIIFYFKAGKDFYTVKRSFKIRKGGTVESEAFLFKNTLNGPLTLADNVKKTDAEIEEILGLSCEEFKKCVILPQGEFANFIKAQRADRIGIIGSLFNIEHYGDSLYQKIKARYDEAEGCFKEASASIAAIGETDSSLLKEIEENINKLNCDKENIEKEIGALETVIKETENSIAVLNEIRVAKDNLTNLLKQKEEFEKAEKELLICRKAAVIFPLYKDCSSAEKKQEELSESLANEKQKSESIRQQFEKAEKIKCAAEKEYSEKAEKLSGRIFALKTLLSDAENIQKNSAEREKLLDEYNRIKKQLEEVVNNKNKNYENINKINFETENIEKQYDINRLLKKNYLLGSIDEINEAIEYLKKGYEKALPHFYDKKAQKQKQLEQMGDTDIEKYKEALVKLKELKEEIAILQNKYNAVCADEAALKEKLASVEDKGKRLKNERLNIEEKFKSLGITGDFTPETVKGLINTLSRELETIKSNKEKSCLDFEEKRKKQIENETEISKLNALLNEAQTAFYDKTTALSKALTEQGIRDINDLKNIDASEIHIKELEIRINDYNRRLSAAQGAYDAIKNKAVTVDKEKFDKILQEYEGKKEARNNINERVGNEKHRLTVITENIQKIEKYKDVKSLAQKKLDRLDILLSLVKGKHFMEYAAEEYIQEITQQASRHISHITGGRYALKYIDGNFMVEDNYCGGEIRPVNTLSGGETFLVSLSLAVSLSESIVKMSDKPVEFFFLDEGFGTLDKELCETVMNTLEKLKQTHFTIGIISHVQEIMHRLTHKLMLTPPDGNGNGTDVKLIR